jgi:hypothetical protein
VAFSVGCQCGQDLSRDRFSCDGDADCAAGNVCLGGVCTAAADGGTADGGPDSGAVDSGTSDSGAEDAGAPDAGSVRYVSSGLLFGPTPVNSQSAFVATGTIDPGADPSTVLVVGFDMSGRSSACSASPTITAVSDQEGQTYVRFSAFALDFGVCDAGSSTDLEIWYTVSPVSGPTTVSVAYTGPPPIDAGTLLSFGAIAFAGVDTLNPLRNPVTAWEATGSPVLSVSVQTQPNDMVSEIICNGTQPGTPVGAPRQTEAWESSSSAVACAAPGAGTVLVSGASYTDLWAVADDFTAMLAFDIAHAP